MHLCFTEHLSRHTSGSRAKTLLDTYDATTVACINSKLMNVNASAADFSDREKITLLHWGGEDVRRLILENELHFALE